MPLRGDVERLRARAIADLIAAHDHFSFTRLLWAERLAETQYGLHSSELNLNPITGSQLDDRTLATLASSSIEHYLPSAAIQQFVAVTEAFLGDLIRRWVTAYPFHLKGQVDVQTVVAATDRDAILQPLIDQYAIAMAYKAPRDWFKQLNAVVDLGGVPTDDQVDAFAELKATRDVMVHHRGFANPTYVRKAGPLARAVDGQPIDLPDDYVSDAWDKCRAMVDVVGTAAVGRA